MRLNWQLWEGVIPSELCDQLVRNCKDEISLRDGTVFSEDSDSPNEGVRKTKLGFTGDDQIKTLVDYYLKESNRNAFAVDVNYIPDVQFAEYTKGCFYNWHHDINWDAESAYDRKLSISIQLTDPSEYKGGDFEFKNIETPTGFRTKGSIVVFPSYHEHRVTEVTDGVRHSLVCWMEGPKWR